MNRGVHDGSFSRWPRTASLIRNGFIDCAGNVYWASCQDGSIYVFSPDGREIGRISDLRDQAGPPDRPGGRGPPFLISLLD